MAARKPAECPSCGAQGTVYGPEPYQCAVCAYVVTPAGDDEPPEEETE